MPQVAPEAIQPPEPRGRRTGGVEHPAVAVRRRPRLDGCRLRRPGYLRREGPSARAGQRPVEFKKLVLAGLVSGADAGVDGRAQSCLGLRVHGLSLVQGGRWRAVESGQPRQPGHSVDWLGSGHSLRCGSARLYWLNVPCSECRCKARNMVESSKQRTVTHL